MASLSDVIDIIIRADDQASRGIASVGNALTDLDGRVQGVAAPFASLADGVLKADAVLAGLALTLGTLAVKETVQFQDSLYTVQKQLGDTGVSIEQARADIEALALAYGTNANEVAESVANFLAAGFDYQTSAKLVETSTQLMIAGQLEASTATDAITRSLAGFRVPASEASDAAVKVGDILNKIGDISSGKFEEIVTAFEQFAPTAKDAGLSMEEAAASVAVLVDIFGSGEIAATALKSGLLSLLAPSAEAEETLKSLGVSITSSNGELRSSKEILTDLASKWSTLTDAQKQQTAAIVFGKEQAGAMSALLGDWGKQQDYVAQMLDKTSGAVGSMAREVEGKLKLLSTQIDISQESWRQFLERFGERLVAGDGISDLVESVGSLGRAFKDVTASGGFDEIIDWAQRGFARLSAIVDDVAENLPAAFEGVDWSGLIDALDDLGATASDVLSGLFGDVDLTTVDGLRSAIQTTIDTLESLTRTTQGIATAFTPVAEAIGQAVLKFNELDAESKIDFGETIGSAKVLVDLGTGLGVSLIAIGKAGLDMSSALDVAFGSVRVAVNALQVAFDSAVLGILSLTKSALETAGFRSKAEELQLVMDAVAANGLRNAEEFKAGWAQATGEGAARTEEMRASLERAEQALTSTREATRQTGVALSADLAPAAADVREAFAGLSTDQFSAVVAIDELSSGFGSLLDGLSGVNPALEMVKDGFDKTTEKTHTLKMEQKDLLTAVETTEDGITKYTWTSKNASDQLEKNAEATKKAKDETENYRIKLAEIQAEIQQAQLEAFVSIKTTQLETDAERVKATFESIDTTISSTGDLLGSLFSNLIDATSLRDKFSIEEQIDLENQRRQEALDIQKELASAEIARIQAQTEALERGDSIITIEGDGLEPELEAFMWAILKRIRIRANAEFQDYLLGMSIT